MTNNWLETGLGLKTRLTVLLMRIICSSLISRNQLHLWPQTWALASDSTYNDSSAKIWYPDKVIIYYGEVLGP